MTQKILLWGERETPMCAMKEREYESSSTIGKKKKEVVSASLFRWSVSYAFTLPRKDMFSLQDVPSSHLHESTSQTLKRFKTDCIACSVQSCAVCS